MKKYLKIKKMTGEKIELNYDYEKVVKEFDYWLKERIKYLDGEVDIKESRNIRVAEAYRIQARFNSIKQQQMLLK